MERRGGFDYSCSFERRCDGEAAGHEVIKGALGL